MRGGGLSARENPFAVQRVERLLVFEPAWLGLSWEEILARLGKLNYRAAVVGPHGSGKTTFLDGLEERLSKEGMSVTRLRLNDESGAESKRQAVERAGAAGPKDLLFFDGAEQLGPWGWWRLNRAARLAKGLILTQHRPGRLPTLFRTRATPAMLEAFANTLLEGRDAGARPSPEELLTLFQHHRGNLREALLGCYDLMGRR